MPIVECLNIILECVNSEQYLLVDEFGDDRELCQLLVSGLRPDVVCWYVSSPVDPVPRSDFSSIFQEVLHRA